MNTMQEITNGKETLTIERQQQQVLVTLRKLQYDAEALDIIGLYVQSEETEEGLQIFYPLSHHAVILSDLVQTSLSKLEKLQLVEKICHLFKQRNQYRVPFLHPKNLCLDGEQLKVIHYGISDALTPMKIDELLLFKDIKALILHVFHPELPFEQLIQGGIALKDKFSETISQFDEMEALDEFIQNELREQKKFIATSQRLVSKTKYLVYRTVGIVGILLATVSGIFSYYFWRASQKQEAIIAAQSNFIVNNYAATQDELEGYSPESLPKSAQYILAVSSIQLTDLTDEQKESVLNTISVKTDENTLNYWIYTGRGNFKEALNLAQNLGDDQLILLAYTNLYQLTKLDSKMDGAEKQKLLADYTKEIENLQEKLTGDSQSESNSD